MSQINVDNIKNRLGSGAPSFPNGIDVSSGVTTFTNGLNVGTGASVFSPTTNVLALGTNSAERVRVDSSGNLGIGTDNPNYKLHLHSTTTGDSNYLQITHADTGGGSSDGLQFGLGTGSSPIAYIAQKENADLVFQTNASEKMRLLSGGGLTFNGDTADANALDDYEEGTWTVGYSFAGGDGNSAITGSSASYTKIGRMVYVAFDIALTVGTASGNFTITGLPYARGGSSLRSGLHPTFLVTTTLTNALRLYISDSSTTVNLYDGTGTNSYNATKMGSSFQLIAQGCYQIA